MQFRKLLPETDNQVIEERFDVRKNVLLKYVNKVADLQRMRAFYADEAHGVEAE